MGRGEVALAKTSGTMAVEESMNATLGELRRRFPLFHPAESLAPAHWLAQGTAPRGAAAAVGAIALICVISAFSAQGVWFYMFSRFERKFALEVISFLCGHGRALGKFEGSNPNTEDYCTLCLDYTVV